MAQAPKGKKKRRKQGARELTRELKEYQQEPLDYCQFKPNDSDSLLWDATIQGPDDTPYAGGEFEVSIKFPKTYPLKHPSANMKTKCYHMNINDKGKVCCAILDNEWNVDCTTADVARSIYGLLKEPMPDSAINEDALTLYVDNEKEYIKIATQFTQKFANPNGTNINTIEKNEKEKEKGNDDQKNDN